MTSRYNAVIVGQTGVGKSTLINYLYGSPVAKVGIGKPVTQNGFHPIDFEINGLPVRLFDSWGLEVGKEDEWLKDLDEELKNRGVNKPADQWFHSVFYCIQAGGARVQDCDIKIINKFIKENYKVCVVLTKCDQVDEDVENELRKVLTSQIEGIAVMSICSEEKKTRSGTSKSFGKEDIEKQAFSDFFDSLITRLPLRCESIMKDLVAQWLNKSNSEDIGWIGLGGEEVRKKIRESAEMLPDQLSNIAHQEIKNTLAMYGYFAVRLGYPPTDANDTTKIGYQFGENEDPFDWWRLFSLDMLIISRIPERFLIFCYEKKRHETDKTKNEINFCEIKLNEIIEEHITNVTKILNTLKSKATKNIILIGNK